MNRTKVFIPCSGGLGDIIQTYLANPKSHIYDGGPDVYPTPNHASSVWLRRLACFKSVNPDVLVEVILFTHCPDARELFEYHPHIDEIDLWDWRPPQPEDAGMWDKEYKGAVHISSKFDYTDYLVNEPKIYLSDEEQKVLDKVTQPPFVVLHPFAAFPRQALKLKDYLGLIDYIIGHGYRVIITGGRNDVWPFRKWRNLVNLAGRASTALSTAVVLRAQVYIGVHTSMILAAWYRRIPTLLIVPGDILSWSLKNQSYTTIWGVDKPFTQVIQIQQELNTNELFNAFRCLCLEAV